MADVTDLLLRIETFLALTGMGQARFGDLVMNDRSFVEDVRAGRDLRASTIRKVDQFIAGWKDGTLSSDDAAA